jgi:hypothetical protein
LHHYSFKTKALKKENEPKKNTQGKISTLGERWGLNQTEM